MTSFVVGINFSHIEIEFHVVFHRRLKVMNLAVSAGNLAHTYGTSLRVPTSWCGLTGSRRYQAHLHWEQIPHRWCTQ
jgi:hypothetical protein